MESRMTLTPTAVRFLRFFKVSDANSPYTQCLDDPQSEVDAGLEDYPVANPMAKLTVLRGLLSQTDRISGSIAHLKIYFEANVRYL